ncbi:MAG: flagellin [Rhodospirillaceae bacterium]|nr:flagellin [Rhodospirillaceae bacterium]
MRVSTAGMNSQMISQALRVQSKYAEALDQQASGVKSESLSDLEGQAGAVISLKADIASSEHLATQTELAASKLEIAYSTVDSIADQATSMRTSISAAITGTADATTLSTLQSSAASCLENVVSLLNTQYADSYIFSGGETLTAPVDLSDTDYDATSTTADTDYYQGGDNLAKVMLDSDSSVSYGVTASDSGFEETIRALQTIINATTLDTATLQTAFDLMTSAISDLGTTQETLSAQTSTLNSITDTQTEFQIYANEALESLTSVDVAEATAIVSQQEVLLQASFAALSSLKSISVLNYL